MNYKKNRAELRELLGYRVNRFARSMLDSLSDSERTHIVTELRRAYLDMTGRNYTGKLLRGLKNLLTGLERLSEVEDKNIIERHNLCYFWSRMESSLGSESICDLYLEIISGERIEHPMVYTTVGSGVLLSNSADLSRKYLISLSNDTPQDICNRIYHRVYYGDVEYKNTKTFFVDEHGLGTDDWINTRANILKRLESNELRSKVLRGLDLVTFRRMCETRGNPALSHVEQGAIVHCLDNVEGLSQPVIQLLREELEKLIFVLNLTNR